MAAGQGFKTFTTGEVLTAGDVNGYLMQGINVFATATARDAAITAPAEGQFAYTKDNNSLWYYDGAAWVASGATGDIEGVTAGNGLSGGGTSGTVSLAINTAITADLSTAQTLTNKTLTSPALTTPTISTLTTNGDILYGTGSGAITRRGIGSSGDVLTVSGGVPTWATPAAGGGLTLIATATPSSSTTVSFTSIPSYKYLKVVWFNVWHSATNEGFYCRINSDTGANYNFKRLGAMDNTIGTDYGTDTGGFGAGGSNQPIRYSTNSSNAANNYSGHLEINGANVAAGKYVNYLTAGRGGGTVSTNDYIVNGYWNNTATVTQIDFIRSGTQTLTGTFQLWGMN